MFLGLILTIYPIYRISSSQQRRVVNVVILITQQLLDVEFEIQFIRSQKTKYTAQDSKAYPCNKNVVKETDTCNEFGHFDPPEVCAVLSLEENDVF